MFWKCVFVVALFKVVLEVGFNALLVCKNVRGGAPVTTKVTSFVLDNVLDLTVVVIVR